MVVEFVKAVDVEAISCLDIHNTSWTKQFEWCIHRRAMAGERQLSEERLREECRDAAK